MKPADIGVEGRNILVYTSENDTVYSTPDFDSLHPIFWHENDGGQRRPNTIYETLQALKVYTDNLIDNLDFTSISGSENCITNCSYTKAYIGTIAFDSTADPLGGVGSMVDDINAALCRVAQIRYDLFGGSYSFRDHRTVGECEGIRTCTLASAVQVLLDLHSSADECGVGANHTDVSNAVWTDTGTYLYPTAGAGRAVVIGKVTYDGTHQLELTGPFKVEAAWNDCIVTFDQASYIDGDAHGYGFIVVGGEGGPAVEFPDDAAFGGDINFTGGIAGAAIGALTSRGGNVSLIGGSGSTKKAAGGGIVLTGAVGGVFSGTGYAGGSINISSGAGGNATGSNPAGVAGDIILYAGDGGTAVTGIAGVGGNVEMGAGEGGSPSAAGTPANGGYISLFAGKGGEAFVLPGGVGGTFYIDAGVGGNANGPARTSGTGGNTEINAGPPGPVSGGATPGVAGNIKIGSTAITTLEIQLGTNTFGAPTRISKSCYIEHEFRLGVATQSGAGNISSTATIIGFTAGGFTATLSSAIVEVGKIKILKDQAGTAGTSPVTIATQGAEKIDGLDTVSLNQDYGSITFYSNGTNWFII
jgi:hypothetical protein